MSDDVAYFGLPPGTLNDATAERMRKVLREVWHQRSWQKRMALARATDSEGFTVCEECHKRAPKVHVDHIVRVGKPDGGFLARLFVHPDTGLKVLCVRCHKDKTAIEQLDFFLVKPPRKSKSKKRR